MNTTTGYDCPHCEEHFATSARLGGHTHARHPEVRRSLPKFLRTPSYAETTRHSGPSRKRDTDSWPGKP